MAIVRTILFDYGGVIAGEGFEHGLRAIAESNGYDPSDFFADAARIVYDCGYVTGGTDEHGFWAAVRSLYPMKENDPELSDTILAGFAPRPEMLALVNQLRGAGVKVGILSDQSDWLDRLDARHHFFRLFDGVFNSYHLGKTKRDPSLFLEIETLFGGKAPTTLFVDDNLGHIGRAAPLGFQTHHFTGIAACVAACRKAAAI